jgi:AcrR family transcriptional regulator
MTSKPLHARANRRVHSKSIETRQRILDAAARALAEQGYSEAKLSDIAHEAGTHAGSLYYYFTSREDLMMEVLLTSLGRMAEFSASLEHENAHLSPLDRVLAFVRLVIEQTLAPDDYYLRAYMRNGNQVPDNMRKVLKTRRHRVRRTLARLLREAQAAEQIPAHIDAGVAAQFIVGATNWVGMWYESTGRYSVDKITETFVDLALHGLLGTPTRKRPVP